MLYALTQSCAEWVSRSEGQTASYTGYTGGLLIDKDNEVRYYAYEYMKQRNPNVWLNEYQVNFDEPLGLV
ncbi:hypothetical protein [Vibrio phage J14]|nr:hypothetical protein [Vibrio phage J14]